jgi:hypothetical protein
LCNIEWALTLYFLFTKQSPIKFSLLDLDPKASKAATEIFQNIMKWMEDFPLGKVR